MIESGSSWRQGQVLKHDDAVALGLLEPGDIAYKIVVITHDCDLQSSSDKYIELIRGQLKKAEGQYTRAKHPRTLDLCITTVTADGFDAIELKHENKLLTVTADFTAVEADTDFVISEQEKHSLKQWLAARYGRPAFPDEFEKRLRLAVKGKGNLVKSIAKLCEKKSKFILGIFFDLGNDRLEDLETNIPYELRIVIVYDSEEGGIIARQETESLCAEIKEKFHNIHDKPEKSSTIALVSCNAVADSSFTLYELRRMDQWRLEYISLKDDSWGDFVGAAI